MKVHQLKRTQLLPISLEKAWDFFSNPNNLAKITPADMGFVTITDLKDEPIKEGMLIEYRVKPLFSIPVKWITKIGKVVNGYSFVDNQLKGPYRVWEHTHIFEKAEGGVLMTDIVNYALPLGILGDIAHAVLVKKKLSDIFDYRKETISKFFG